MQIQSTILRGVLFVPVVVVLSTGSPEVLQSQGPTQDAALPHTPWGTPDFRGVWTNATLTPLERKPELGNKEFYTAAEVDELQPVAVRQRIEAIPEPEDRLAVEFSDIWMEAGPLSGRTSLVLGPTLSLIHI